MPESEVIDGNIIIDTQLSKALEYIKTKKSEAVYNLLSYKH